MTKNQIIQKLHTFGDAIVDFKDKSKEPIAVTINLKEKYIKSKLRKNFVKRDKNMVTVWSWSDDQVVNIQPNSVYKLTPLSKILNNEDAM
jgi:hypothetical protein